MNNILIVFLGGGLGSLARYGVAKFISVYGNQNLHCATFISNVSSCLILGLVVGLTLDKNPLNTSLRLLLITGFCGGFSTFSAFSLETFELLRTGQAGIALLNICFNVITCLLCIWAGLSISTKWC
jgi:CrcB protein